MRTGRYHCCVRKSSPHLIYIARTREPSMTPAPDAAPIRQSLAGTSTPLCIGELGVPQKEPAPDKNSMGQPLPGTPT
nr:hypothetical protein CFP56_72402 [Quercus suber]